MLVQVVAGIGFKMVLRLCYHYSDLSELPCTVSFYCNRQ